MEVHCGPRVGGVGGNGGFGGIGVVRAGGGEGNGQGGSRLGDDSRVII